MSVASAEVTRVVDHITSLARKHATPADIYTAMLPGFVTLILERLDNIEREIRFANEREVR